MVANSEGGGWVYHAWIHDPPTRASRHFPFLTIRETLEFARDCTQVLQLENFTPHMRKFFAHALVEGQDPFLEYVIEILSLKHIENKLIGEAISDVDRQKLTTAELALGTYSIMIYDQPFSGCDLAATYDLVDTIRTISRIQQSSAIMSLTQLSQEVFNLFDRIILLTGGHVLFQGPCQDVIPYFAKLGYIKPSYVESSEFLEDIAAGDGSQYIVPGATPLTLEELVECYRASDHYKDIMRIVKGDDAKHTYWLESEPGIGLSLKTPSKYQEERQAVGEIPYFLMETLAVVGIGNGMASIGTQSPSEFIKFWTVLFLFTLCLIYFGMMITFLAPVPTLAAFAVAIVTSLWVSASGVVVLLSDIKFYKWMFETIRSLSHERIDLDILILSAMCLLFASLASVFFVVLRHNSPPPHLELLTSRSKDAKCFKEQGKTSKQHKEAYIG
uniref:ABC-2 type transporter transmembrane domain-containing protein n=1 Tax=Quercus lobata TaxID=97700 RepID=A0A7N2L4M7_QUELO